MLREESIGDPSSRFWVVTLAPSEGDLNNGILNSGSVGYEMRKWGLPMPHHECTIFSSKAEASLSLKGDASALSSLQRFVSKVDHYKPPIILSLGDGTLKELCPFVMAKRDSKGKCLTRYAGSLLSSPLFNHSHYVLGTYSADELFANWKERDIALSIDVARIKEEYLFYIKQGVLQPLQQRTIITDKLSEEELLNELSAMRNGAAYVSTDIETIRPTKASTTFRKHPGCVYTLGLASSPYYGLSFFLSDYSSDELVEIFRALDDLFKNVPQIYQNGHSFDQKFLSALGFSLCGYVRSRDTRIQHHILWPSLPHSLQFMTRQYTRQVFYKDEGKGFMPRNEKLKAQLKHYNALDCLVTYEIFERQCEELVERGLF